MDSISKRKLNETEGDQQIESVSKQRKVIGPCLPPSQDAAHTMNSKTGSDSDDDDDDDDDFGPSLPPSAPLEDFTQPEPKITNTADVPSSEEKESQRDQWMLQPPTHSDWASKVDPTQLRNRKFNTGKAASAPKHMDSSWVETPEERMRRLQDAVMGVSSSTHQATNQVGSSKTKLVAEKIQKYKDITGKAARLETSGQAQKEDDDPSGRAFDREKDMAVSSKISNAQRREMVKKAADYSTRFTQGNFL
ncbi:uncharacterized protein N7515_005232 [Penicillium bovifimosum]|uniref:DUF3752 domain-containing protein n=1 Tax=Penicillium bovifimosum TaxID=126998 RepID=A0A9W9GSQ4_9EURO|nr:uncharacterized protein N7515_005232 [Penicillium bovifimosum]KAJ5129193.1 hypothetical protein N7515_005232 [Penicillium bovifimosum]